MIRLGQGDSALASLRTQAAGGGSREGGQMGSNIELQAPLPRNTQLSPTWGSSLGQGEAHALFVLKG